jgi:predicted dehydrogenase
MSRIIRWGVIGTANIARVAVIPAIQAAEGSVVSAVASRDPDKAKAFAAKLEIPCFYGTYQELLNDPDIDAVYIPLPNSLHMEWAVKAMNAGKHVLSEKPLALNSDQCRMMEKAAKDNNVLLMEAFMYRFHPRTVKVKEMIEQGVIGDVSTIEASFTFRLNNPENIRLSADLGGGALMDVGCYCVNVIRTMIGQEPVAVSAFSVPAESGVDGSLTGLISFPGGVTAHFDCSLTQERRERYLVAGTDGFLEVSNAFLPGTNDCTIREVRGRSEEKIHTIKGVDEYCLMVEHFTDCIINNKNPRYNAAEAAANMDVINALKKSAGAHGKLTVSG